MKRFHQRFRVALVAALTALTAVVAVAPTAPARAAGTDKVVLVTGLSEPASAMYAMQSSLQSQGYSVHIYELPTLGTQSIYYSAEDFAGYLNNLTGSGEQVDIVAHSEGGLVSRGAIKWYGAEGSVDSLITLGTPHYGTSVADWISFFSFGLCFGITAGCQMQTDSAFINDLNGGDLTIGDIKYTTFRTNYDLLVKPIDNAALNGANNIRIQDQCPYNVTGHIGLLADHATLSGISDALAEQPITLTC